MKLIAQTDSILMSLTRNILKWLGTFLTIKNYYRRNHE